MSVDKHKMNFMTKSTPIMSGGAGIDALSGRNLLYLPTPPNFLIISTLRYLLIVFYTRSAFASRTLIYSY